MKVFKHHNLERGATLIAVFWDHRGDGSCSGGDRQN